MVPVNSSLVTATLYLSLITALVYNDTEYCPFHDAVTEFGVVEQINTYSCLGCTLSYEREKNVANKQTNKQNMWK